MLIYIFQLFAVSITYSDSFFAPPAANSLSRSETYFSFVIGIKGSSIASRVSDDPPCDDETISASLEISFDCGICDGAALHPKTNSTHRITTIRWYGEDEFQPTRSAWSATYNRRFFYRFFLSISIHALRMERDSKR